MKSHGALVLVAKLPPELRLVINKKLTGGDLNKFIEVLSEELGVREKGSQQVEEVRVTNAHHKLAPQHKGEHQTDMSL